MNYESLKLQILDVFKGLTFNEDAHKYFVDGKPLNTSVSGVIKNFYEPFNSKEKSQDVAQKEGVSQQEILQRWKSNSDEACELGTKVHLFGEVYPFNRHLKPKDGFEQAIVKFWNDLPPHIIPVMMECRMFHLKHLFGGTSDILLYNTKTDNYIIADYKTNKDLFKNFRMKKMLGIFRKFLDNPFNHYQIQLSLYQILLEQVKGIKVESRKIIWLKETGDYIMYDANDFSKELTEQLDIIYS